MLSETEALMKEAIENLNLDVDDSEPMQNILHVSDAEIDALTIKLTDQEKRIRSLLELVEVAIRNDYDEEEIYDQIITKPGSGSPYYIERNFNSSLYRYDLKTLSTIDTLPEWKPTEVLTSGHLYNNIRDKVANERVEGMKSVLRHFFAERGEAGYKTFMRFLKNKKFIASGLINPYATSTLDPTDFDLDILKDDLEHLSESEISKNINELFREVLAEHQNPVRTQIETLDDSFDESAEMVMPEPTAQLRTPMTIGATKEYSSPEGESIFVAELTVLEDSKILTGIFTNSDEANSFLKQGSNEDSERLYVSDSLESKFGSSQTSPTHTMFEVVNDSGNSLFILQSTDNSSLQIFTDELTANNEFQLAVNSYIDESKITDDNNQDSLPPGFALDVANRFEEKAKDDLTFKEAKEVIEEEIGRNSLGTNDDTNSQVKNEYEEVLIKNKASDRKEMEKVSEAMFVGFGVVANSAAKDGLTYSEFYSEAFKKEGIYTDINPYWDDERQRPDRNEFLADLKSAGFESLPAYYDSVFEANNDLTSGEVAAQRLGGYIPTELDLSQPVRPQFKDLEELIVSAGAKFPTRQVIPFGKWIESAGAITPIHPILSEEIGTKPLDQFVADNSSDSITLLADIYGHKSSENETPEIIAAAVYESWEVRKSFAGMGSKELMKLDPVIVEDALIKLNEKSDQSHSENAKALATSLDTLKKLSGLRTAQYSYIANVINNETAGNHVPEFAYKEIGQLISSESEFLDIADKAVELATAERLKSKIQEAINITRESTPLRGAVAQSLASNSGVIIDLGQVARKDTSSLYNDFAINADADSADFEDLSVQYPFIYKLNSKQGADLNLPDNYSSYVEYDHDLIGLNVALPPEYLLQNRTAPVSNEAVQANLGPINDWLSQKGYAGFVDSADNVTVLLENKRKIFQLKIDSKGNQELKKIKDSKAAMLEIHNHASSFCDRDDILSSVVSKIGSIDGFNELNANWSELSKSHCKDAIAVFLDFDTTMGCIDIVENNPDATPPELLQILSENLQKQICDLLWDDLKGAKKNIAIPNDLIDITKGLELSSEVYLGKSLANQQNVVTESVEIISTWQELKSPENKEKLDNLKAAHFDSMSSFDKNMLAVNISSGLYENTEQYLHSEYIRELADIGDVQAKTIQAATYPADCFPRDINQTFTPSASEGNKLLPGILIPVDEGNPKMNVLFGLINEQKMKFSEFVTSHEQLPESQRKLSKFTHSGEFIPKMSFEEFKELPESRIPIHRHLDVENFNKQALNHLNNAQIVEVYTIAGLTGLNNKHLLAEEMIDEIAEYAKDWNESKEQVYFDNVSLQKYSAITSTEDSKPVFDEVDIPATHEYYSLPISCTFEHQYSSETTLKVLQGQLAGNIDNKIKGLYALEVFGLTKNELASSVQGIPDGYDVVALKQDNKVWFKAHDLLNPDQKFDHVVSIDKAIEAASIERIAKDEALTFQNSIVNLAEQTLQSSMQLKTDDGREVDEVALNTNVDYDFNPAAFVNASLDNFKGNPDDFSAFVVSEMADSSGPIGNYGSPESLMIERYAKKLVDDIISVQDSLPANYSIELNHGQYFAASQINSLDFDTMQAYQDPNQIGKDLAMVEKLTSRLGIEEFGAVVNNDQLDHDKALEADEDVSIEPEIEANEPEQEPTTRAMKF